MLSTCNHHIKLNCTSISTMNQVSSRAIVSGLLVALKQKNDTKGSTMQLEDHLCKALIKRKTDLIMLSGLAHLLKKNTRNNEDVKSCLKSIINRTEIPMILVNASKCENIINDLQLARRLTL